MPASEVKISSLSELKIWVNQVSPQLTAQKLVLLHGEMGAGKTTFINYLVQTLGGTGASSPTFTFHQSYKIKNGSLHHFDLYRVSTEEDLESVGVWEHLQNSSELTLIEWAGRLNTNHFPSHWKVLKIDIQVINESTRLYKLSGFLAV